MSEAEDEFLTRAQMHARASGDWSYIGSLLRPRRLQRFLEAVAGSRPRSSALECDDRLLSYAELDAAGNQLAHHLRGLGIAPGMVVGILIERSVAMYVAIVGALKAGATYVPIDPNAPADRVEYITGDAGVRVLLTTSDKCAATEGLALERVLLDDLDAVLAPHPVTRPEVPDADDPAAYIIYTSGSTGRPKGVAVAHSSICNFITVACQVYGVRPSDHVYQGLSISFDFSLEELWTTWGSGARLVAGPTDGRKVGPGLADFLDEKGITFLHAVPTVLATLDRVLPRIRTLNLGGEACPQELVERWGRDGRRILNTYGPTECTASCTWAELEAGKPVTIGRALPTYTITLRDENFRVVRDGDVGELCVSGVGVALGYVGRPDLTAEKFVLDEQGRRTYKTGDLGRFTEDGEIEYLGRKDSEVKVRGHRVDLQEIESVLMESPEITAAVLKKLDTEGTGGELVGYIVTAVPGSGTRELAAQLHNSCRRRLPAYMVPDYLEFLDEMPLMPSGKADRGALPPPVHPRLVGGLEEYEPPATPTEKNMVGVWGEILRLPADSLSVCADLFTDLGGHSLIAATLVSKLRASHMPGTADLSIPDLYERPTVRALASFIDTAAALEVPEAAGARESVRAERYPAWRIWLFGLFQALFLYADVLLSLVPIGIIYSLHEGLPSTLMLLEIAVTLPISYLLTRWCMPVFIGLVATRGIREGSFPLYGPMHLRVWLMERSIALSPLPNLAGTHWADRYLRLLGARIGEACHIGTANIALPPMLSAGDNVTIGYGTHLRGHEIEGGRLHIGRIVLRSDVVIGANAVLSGPCTVGRGAVVREQSLVAAGQRIGPGETWAGSPSVLMPNTGDPALDTMLECEDAPRQWSKELTQRFTLGIVFLELLPMIALAPVVSLVWWSLLTWDDMTALAVTAASGPLFVLSANLIILWSRRFALLRTPVGVHHMRSELGVAKWFGDKLLEASLALNNSLYGTLYTSPWLRLLGARVGRGAEIATIANIDPDLLTLQDGTFVADMASIGSATYANGHVAFRKTVVHERAFVGNASFVPSGTQLGVDSLIGVLSTPPAGGTRRGTSWLGAPPIFLPKREVYDEYGEETTFAPPRRKVALRYVVEFFRATLPASLLGLSTFYTLWVMASLSRTWPMWALVLASGAIALSGSVLVTLVVAVMKWVIVGRYRARVEPLWDNFVRRTEFMTGIFETTAVPVLLDLLSGTPMLAPFLRLFGVRVGRRALIDTTYITEFDLVRIGDDATVGRDVSLQTHLFEDRVMKMGPVTVEQGASVASRAVILYGATVGENARVSPLTLIMKGETVPAGTEWAGIPARRSRHGRNAPAESGATGEPLLTEFDEDLADVGHELEDVTEAAPAADRRVIGVDLARALALLGMMTTHILSDQGPDGDMALSWRISSGNAAALFATLAGVGIAFSTGRHRRPRGRKLASGMASLVVRAVLIGAIGLALGSVVPTDTANVILPYYSILFVLAIPLLAVPSRVLAALSILAAVGVPVWSHFVRQGLPVATPVNFTFANVFANPRDALTQLLLTGVFPALPWTAYLLMGMAIGGSVLNRRRHLILGFCGLVLAGLAQIGSLIVMVPLGGLDRIADVAQGYMPLEDFSDLLVWGAGGTLPTDSIWWLGVLAPHTTTPFDLLYTLGIALVVLATCLVVGLVVPPETLRPLTVMGSMPLTMYSFHLLMTALLPVPDYANELPFYLFQVTALLGFALLWSLRFKRGPLEGLINGAVKPVRNLVAGRRS